VSAPRHQLRRIKSLGSYDRAAAYCVLDAALLAHVGFATGAQPFVIPMAYVRDEDTLLLHGAVASRLQRTLASGVEACICVTLLDGIVLARSVFNHSMNYRSVVAFGRAEAVSGPAAKRAALERFTERMLPGRWEDARQPSARELGATTVLRFAMQDVTLKARTGPPDDAAIDMDLPVWAGVLPLRVAMDAPIADAHTRVDFPAYLERFVRREKRARRGRA
jgi:nitroimidazol reductase NimA-like FMN-containing flavoprotein (pyridoxamine 5'-phosphate oxidase superfamily)